MSLLEHGWQRMMAALPIAELTAVQIRSSNTN